MRYVYRSNNVKITPEQVQVFINSVDANQNKTVEKAEFPDLIFHVRSCFLTHHPVFVLLQSPNHPLTPCMFADGHS